jgi:TolB protein
MSPAFSPSGADVYFARQDETGTIFAMPFAGGAIRRVTNSRRGLSSVTVSPDGSRLAYVHDALGNAFVFVTSVDGSSTQPLVTYVGGTKTYYEAPSWSPDGNRIAVQTRSGDDSADQIAILDVATRTPRLMTSSASNEDPSWAPDSRHLVFTSTRVGGKQLWILDTESGNLRQLTRGAPVKTPAWSPPPR